MISENTPDLLENISVLYVEDDPISREALQEFLEEQVHTLYVASNALEGFDLYEKYFPDVLITDIQMSEMNGFELIRAIKNINPKVIAIVISAYNNQDYHNQASELNVDHYLQKPIDLDELLVTLKEKVKNLSQSSNIASDQYIQFLLDSSPFYMLEITNTHISYINHPLLNFLGFDTMSEYHDKHMHFAEVLCKGDGSAYDTYAVENWIHFLLEGSGIQNTLHFMVDKTKSFSINMNSFDNIGKYLIEFVPKEVS